MRALLFSLALLFTAAITRPSLAYNATGHKVIASICYRQLSDAERAALLEILRQHPRFTEDFENSMSNDVRQGDAEVQNEWLFQQAAVWPDLVKSGPSERRAFNRARWHFVNVPHYLTDEDREELEDHVDVNLETDPLADEFDVGTMNVVQAINNSLRILRSDQHGDSEKAVHLCWLLHLTADLHQPLHSTSLFSRGLFPQGDRGGNAVETQPLRNLHSAWDKAFGSSTSFNNCRNLAIQLVGRDDFDSIRHEALATDGPADWRDRSHGVATEHAYNHEVMLQLEDLEQNGDDIDHNPVQFSEDYLRNQRMVTDRLALLTVVRCASTLSGEAEFAPTSAERRPSRTARFSLRRGGRTASRPISPRPSSS